jgi:hypothetical protein
MFPANEAKTCPVCGVSLLAIDKLPPSSEALDDDGAPRRPEWEALPVTYLGRGRGALAALAIFGLAAFASPWVHVTMPDIVTHSGLALSRRLGWSWAAAVAWFVLFPIVVSRRSIGQMRGARVAVSFLAAIPGTTAALLLARPPHGAHGVPVRFSFEWGLYATLALSVIALAVALFFGGRADDIRVGQGTSAGHVVH